MTTATIYCLTLPGFEAMPIVEVMAYLHQLGKIPKVLGLSAHRIAGQYRLCVEPDITIEHVQPARSDVVLVLATQKNDMILTDPRILSYLQSVLQQGGRVILLGEVAGRLARLGFPPVAHASRVITPTQQAMTTWDTAWFQVKE